MGEIKTAKNGLNKYDVMLIDGWERFQTEGRERQRGFTLQIHTKEGGGNLQANRLDIKLWIKV